MKLNKMMLRNILLLLFVTFLSQSSYASEKDTVVFQTVITCDHCLQCGSCGKNIYNHIKDNNKGIRKIDVDAEANTITIIYNPRKTDTDQIKSAILSSGYDVNGEKADPEAIAKLDDCCKK